MTGCELDAILQPRVYGAVDLPEKGVVLLADEVFPLEDNDMTHAHDADHQKVVEAAKAISSVRSGNSIPVVLTGRIVNGKVHIDQHVLDEIAKSYPNANGSFIAVNAPFDPNGSVSNGSVS